MSSENQYIEFNPLMWLFGGGIFMEVVAHEGDSLLNGISALIKETLEN